MSEADTWRIESAEILTHSGKAGTCVDYDAKKHSADLSQPMRV
jgi:hypothetical protein